MKRLALGLVLIVAVLVGAVLAVPYVIDVNDYKDEIAEKVAGATGRRVAIDGDIRIRILPAPSISVAGVRLANAAGGTTEEMLRLEAARARLALWPLLRGDIQIESVTLVRPVLVLERLADGSGNWTLAPPAAPGGGAGPAVRLDRLIVEDGTLLWRAGGGEERIEGVNLEAAAGSLTGPFRAEGRLALRGVPVKLKATLGALGGETVPLGFDLRLAGGGAAVTFGGTVAPATGHVAGRLKAEATPLEKVYAVIAPEVASTGVLAAALAQSASFTGTLEASAGEVAVNKIALSLDGAQGTGAVSVALGARPRVDLALSLNRLDLDGWLAAAGENGGAGPAAGFALPAGFDAGLDLRVDAVVYREQVIRQLQVVAGLDSGVVTLQQAFALLPGGSDLTLFGVLDAVEGAPHFTGQVEASSDNLRAVLDWLAVPLPAVPADRLRTLSLATRIELTPALAKVSDLDLRIDVSRLTGGVNLALARRPAFNAIVSIDKINLDAYLPAEAPAGESALGDPFAALGAVNGELKAEIGRLVYNATPASGIVIDAGLRGGALSLRRLSVEDFAGLRGRLSGSAEGRRFDVTFAVRAEDLARAARAGELALPTALEGLGPLATEGRLAGDADRIEIDAKLAAAGAAAQISGTLADPLAEPAADLRLAVSGDDLKAFAGRLGQAAVPAGLAGAFSLEGTVKGRPEKLGLDAEAVVAGATIGLSGTVEARSEPLAFDLAATFAHADAAGLVATFAPASPLAGRPLGAVSAKASAKGDLAETRLTGRVAALDGEVGFEGTAKDLTGALAYDLALAVNHADVRALAARLKGGAARAGKPQALAATMRAAGDRAAVRVSALKATVGPSTITGSVEAAWSGARPRVAIAAEADSLDAGLFAALGGEAPSAPAPPAATPSPAAAPNAPAARWSKAPLDLAALRSVDGSAKLAVGTLTAGPRRIEKVVLDARLTEGVLTVDELSGTLYGGPARLTGTVDATATPAITSRIALEGSDLEALLRDLAGIDRLGGRLTLDGSFKARGASVYELVSALAGQATIAAQDGVVRGIDLGRLNVQLGSLSSKGDYLNLLGIALTGGETPIRRLRGTVTAKGGVLTSDDISAELDGAVATAAFSADLPRWWLTLDSRFQLTGHRDSPPIGVRLEGPLDAPRRSNDTKALEKFLLARLVEVGVKKLAPKLGGEAGGAIGGILKAITGEAPAAPEPTPAPAPAPSPQPTPAPSPQPAPQPAVPFKNLLEGLLKGAGD